MWTNMGNEINNAKPSNQLVVTSLLRKLLADAEAGKFKGLGVVMVPVSGNPPFMMATAGEGFCEIHTGCGALQDILVQSIIMQSQSKVLRPSPIPHVNPGTVKGKLFSGD